MANGKKLFDGNVLRMVATSDTNVRDIVEFEAGVGVALTEGTAGNIISVDTVGVYEFDCETADEVAVGDMLYWNSTDKVVTIDSDSGNRPLAGYSWGTKPANESGTVGVKIG